MLRIWKDMSFKGEDPTLDSCLKRVQMAKTQSWEVPVKEKQRGKKNEREKERHEIIKKKYQGKGIYK